MEDRRNQRELRKDRRERENMRLYQKRLSELSVEERNAIEQIYGTIPPSETVKSLLPQIEKIKSTRIRIAERDSPYR